MPEENIIETLAPDPDTSTVGRVLIGADHNTLKEAIAADFVDAIPLGGDALLLVRSDRADEKGIDFPTEQARIQNVVSDLPPPWDYVAESLSAPSTVAYVEENPDATIAPGVQLDTYTLDEYGIEFVVPEIVSLPEPLSNPADKLLSNPATN